MSEPLVNSALKYFAPVLATGLGAIIGFFGSWLQRKWQRDDENRKIVREKLFDASLLCYEYESWIEQVMVAARKQTEMPDQCFRAEKVESLIITYGSEESRNQVQHFIDCYKTYCDNSKKYCDVQQSHVNEEQIVRQLNPCYSNAKDASVKLRTLITEQMKALVQ